MTTTVENPVNGGNRLGGSGGWGVDETRGSRPGLVAGGDPGERGKANTMNKQKVGKSNCVRKQYTASGKLSIRVRGASSQ